MVPYFNGWRRIWSNWVKDTINKKDYLLQTKAARSCSLKDMSAVLFLRIPQLAVELPSLQIQSLLSPSAGSRCGYHCVLSPVFPIARKQIGQNNLVVIPLLRWNRILRWGFSACLSCAYLMWLVCQLNMLSYFPKSIARIHLRLHCP